MVVLSGVEKPSSRISTNSCLHLKRKESAMSRLFGTDGIRARAGEFPLNSAAIVAIGRAIGEKLGGTILVAQDTRLSSPWILEFLHQGIRQTSASIEDAGV